MFRVVLAAQALWKEPLPNVTGLDPTFRVDGDTGVISLNGEMRVESIPLLDDAIEQARAQGALHLLLDLSRLLFMDSASAGALLRIKRDQGEAGGKLVLFGLQRMVARLIDAAGLAAQFDVASDEEGARILAAGL